MNRTFGRFVLSTALGAATFSAAALLHPPVARAEDPAAAKETQPAAKEVIEKYINATGGRALFESIKSRRSTGTFEVPAAQMKGELSIVQASPDKSLATIDVPGIGKILKGSNDGTYWEINPMTGVRLLDPPEAEEMQRQLLFESDLNWEKYFESAETVGTESVDGRPAWKLKLVAASDGKVNHYYYDKESGLLVRTDTSTQMQGNTIPVTTHISEYKDFNGVKVATVIRMELAGMEQRITIANDEHNPTIEPSTFELPADVKALKAKVTPGK